MHNVLVTARAFGRFSQEPYEILSQAGCSLAPNPWQGQKLDEAALLTLVSDIDALICGEDEVTAKVIAAAPRLRVISKFGVGVDKIAVAAATERGIPVCNAPGANSESVADMAFCLLLGIARRLPYCDGEVRRGKWQSIIGCEIYGKTIGIMGLGKIGKAVARRAKGFGMKILAYDAYPDAAFAAQEGVTLVDMATLLREADFVSLHVPSSPDNKAIIASEQLAMMKPSAFLINTARGDLVDEDALYLALKTGKLAGAAVDVFAQEPPNPASPLLGLENIVVAPHVAAHTVEAINNMGVMSARNAVAIINNGETEFIVNQRELRKGEDYVQNKR